MGSSSQSIEAAKVWCYCGELLKSSFQILSNFRRKYIGIERWPRAGSGCQLYGGRHRDFECV